MLGATEKEQKALDTATREYNYTKEDLSRAKILNKLKSKPKSKEQLKLEAKYKKEKKMTDDEAAVAAYQHIRTKKMLMVVGGVAVTAAVVYAGYKMHDARVDKIIKSGTLLQNMSPDGSMGVRDAFYSSSNKLDKLKYRGLYGIQLNAQHGGAFKKEIKVLSDIRQASPKNAQKIFTELAEKDPTFAKDFHEYLLGGNALGPKYTNKNVQAGIAIRNGIFDKNVYEVFNANLAIHSPEMQSLTDRFYKTLTEKGYNAIKDVNDAKYSGYQAINPIISFGTKGKVEVVDVKKLSDAEIAKYGKQAIGSLVGSALAKQGSLIVGGTLSGKFANKVIKKHQDQDAVDKYRQENPGTTMTNTEIIRMLERSKK